MCSWVRRTALACWGAVRRYARMGKDEDEDDDMLLWSRDIGRHSVQDFSFAVVQANENLEEVEMGRAVTFVGVYDGHGGPDASKFIGDHLFVVEGFKVRWRCVLKDAGIHHGSICVPLLDSLNLFIDLSLQPNHPYTLELCIHKTS